MRLSDHFSLYELTRSDIAKRLGIDNRPSESVVASLRYLAVRLETVRDVLGGMPMEVSSGFRCLALNKVLRSKDTSDHVKGLAVDFTCPAFGSPVEVCLAIVATDIDFSQLILEYGDWCHISFPAPGGVGKRQVLTIDQRGTRAGLPVA